MPELVASLSSSGLIESTFNESLHATEREKVTIGSGLELKLFKKIKGGVYGARISKKRKVASLSTRDKSEAAAGVEARCFVRVFRPNATRAKNEACINLV